MRVAIVSLMGGTSWGGSEVLWHALANYALGQKDQVFVSIYYWGALHEKVKVLQTKGAIINTRKRYNSNAHLKERIVRFIRKRKPSLDRDYQAIIDFRPNSVFISQGDSFDLAVHHRPLYNLLRQHKIPYSFVCHNHAQYSFIPPPDIFPGAVEIFQNARKVYFVSERQWKITERRLATIIKNGAFTWNPLNLQLPTAPLKWPNEELICLAIVGSLGGTKGQDTVLEVLSEKQWETRNWRLNIYGSGDGLIYLQSLASFYKIEDKVHFKGYEKDILHLWSENHLLLIGSAGEGLPISLAEAMACGRAAVVTDVGGNTELITEGENGFIAVSPTAGAFSSALENAWKNKQNWKQMGALAFQKISSCLENKPELKIYAEL
ncbi:MAG: glycosyltransferase family 4 protein [Bacteroidota bacterium]|nr:glycosyltransferase family 4 protein [Bacteroidota bacterium]